MQKDYSFVVQLLFANIHIAIFRYEILHCTRLEIQKKETNRKRVEARHAAAEPEQAKKFTDFLTGIYDAYEDAQPGEENCITVHVDPNDTPDDVMQKILKQVDDLEA